MISITAQIEGIEWIVLLALLAVIFLVFIWYLLRHEGQPAAPMVYYPQPVAHILLPPQPGQKFCPVCGNHYPPEYNNCPRDSSPLKPVQQ